MDSLGEGAVLFLDDVAILGQVDFILIHIHLVGNLRPQRLDRRAKHIFDLVGTVL